MLRTAVSLAVCLACATLVLAGIYGTSPVANTVWTAGRSESVTWTDDKSHPKLSKLGPVDIQLYSGTDSLVAVLAQDVDPERKSLSTWISPSWGQDGSDYYITFHCKKPPVTVFTATFTILGMANTTSPFNDRDTHVSNHNMTISHLPMASLTSAMSPSSSSAQPSSTLPPISPEDEEDYLRHHDGIVYSEGSTVLRMDYERLKFRVVFIIWPAVIGISMAL